jgi:hypothetical protein
MPITGMLWQQGAVCLVSCSPRRQTDIPQMISDSRDIRPRATRWYNGSIQSPNDSPYVALKRVSVNSEDP